MSGLPDHPRACGEHADLVALDSARAGSSPRLRGALKQCVNRVVKAGIIPALAGSTSPRHSSLLARGDHPRACGEHMETGEITDEQAGSSPRLRGALAVVCAASILEGIIPALAGSTGIAALGYVPSRDHPRACGEHRDPDEIGMVDPGSSPRLRGAPHEINVRWRRLGIIPALAGSTLP